ncbi:protein-methionine-sulfoxide reductase catalytic subunit MsrP [Ningiella sp. W23]|uniref:protein-methionine-sulfoxide reductase catalytic subunit MsrP n=1 Tax=Ningiella sp. W23 TaxID=3023715 RepID=UPI003756322C
MLIKSSNNNRISENEVTDPNVYHSRRDILKKLGFLGAGTLLSTNAQANPFGWFSKKDSVQFETTPLDFENSSIKLNEPVQKLTEQGVATSYNNFYEFGTSKSAPKEKGQELTVNPWLLEIGGLVENPITLNYEDLLKRFTLEERIYRLRCVEAWSMVIPWIGFELSNILKEAKPLGSAKYVSFQTLYRPEQMPGQNSRFLGGGIDYPYVEGLRLDEAMHPLTLLSVGMYGETLPPQNGAPVRLVLPWKYGFKSIKSLVKIELTEKEPPTTWNILAANEYGFYANVNPNVDHPRWSQARERRIMGSGLNSHKRIDTQMFNGYDEVASMYSNMDLTRYY